MHRSRCRLWALALCVAMPDSALSEPIRESELLAALDNDSIARGAAEAPAAIAEARRSIATWLDAPTLSAGREEVDAEGVEWTWTVAWQPPMPGRRQAVTQSADLAWRAATAGAETTRLERRAAVRAAFASWAVSHARITIRTVFADDLAGLAHIAEARAEAGELPGYVARRCRLAADRAAADTRRAEADAILARGALEALVGPLPTDAEPVLPSLPPEPTLDPATALDEHPRLRAAALDAERDRLAVELARRIVEVPVVEVGWKRLETDAFTSDGPVVGLSWTLPVTSRRRSAVALAEAEQLGSDAERALKRRALDAAVATRLTAFERHREAAQLVAEENAPALRRAVTMGFQLGEIDLSDTLGTFAGLRDAALDDLVSLASTLDAHRALEVAVGRPLEIEP